MKDKLFTVNDLIALQKKLWIESYVRKEKAYRNKRIHKKSAKNRVKYSIKRLMAKKEMYQAHLSFQKLLLTAPVPDYIKRIPGMNIPPRAPTIVSFKRYNDI